jgi:hypothetical protein
MSDQPRSPYDAPQAPPSYPPPGMSPSGNLGPVPPETRCIRCGYILYGMNTQQRCPECGTPVWASYTPDKTSGYAIASLVLGIISIWACMAYGVPGLVCGILAVVFARMAENQIDRGQASPASFRLIRPGRICGWIGIILSGLVCGVIFLFLLGAIFF